MSDQNPNNKIALLEEAERRGRLPREVLSKLRDARAKGLIKTTRNPELLNLEKKIINTDANDMDNSRAAAYANTYRKLRYGEHEDYDGNKRYEKKLTGREYYNLIKDELSGNNISDKFKDDLSEYDKSDENGQIKKAQEYLKKETGRMSNKTLAISKQASVKQLAIGITEGEEETFTDIPDTRTEREQLAEMNPDGMSDQQKAKLREMGRSEAFKRSYVPMRKFLEDKLERDKFANDIANNAIMTGKINEDQFDMLSPETQQFVTQYIRHTRPLDASEGILGTLNEAGRSALSAAWSVGHTGLRNVSADLTVSTTAALWSIADPVEAINYLDAWERERKNLRTMGQAYELKTPERNRLGAAVVGLAETTPHMVALIFGGGVGALGAGASAASHAKGKAIDMGATPEAGNVMAGVAGILSIYAERIGGIGGNTRIGKYLSKPLLAKATSKTVLGYVAKNFPRFAEMVARSGPVELFEEAGEAWFNDITEQVFLNFEMGNFTKVDFKRALRHSLTDAADSSDVVWLMSLFGGGRSFVSEISQNAGEMTYNKAALDKISEQATTYLKENKEDVVEGLEDVNNAIINTWANNNKTEARRLLREMGISEDNLKQAEPTLDSLVDAQKTIKRIATESSKTIEKTESRYAELKPIYDKIGVDSRDVDMLTDSLDPDNVGQYRDGVIEVRNGIKDKARVWNHEAFHFAIKEMGLTESQWEALRKETSKAKYSKLQIRYKDFDGDAKVEEIMADVWAGWSPEIKNIWQKVWDWSKKFVGIHSHTDVFNALDSYVKSMEAGSVTPSYEQAVQADVEAPQRNITSKKKRAKKKRGEKFARAADEVSTLADAAEVYALDKISGRNMAKSAERLAEQTGLPAEQIKKSGMRAYDKALASLDEGATALQQRIAVRTKAAERAITAEVRRAARAGVKIGKSGQAAEQRLVKAKAMEQINALAKAQRTAVSPARMKKLGLSIDALVRGGDANKLLSEVDRLINEIDIESLQVKLEGQDALAQRRMTVAELLQSFVMSNVATAQQPAMLRAIGKWSFPRESDSMKKMESTLSTQMKAINKQIAAQVALGDKQELKGMVKSLLKQDKGNKRTQPFFKKKVDEKTIDELHSIQKAMSMKKAEVDELSMVVANNIDEIGQISKDAKPEELNKQFIDPVLKVFPHLKSITNPLNLNMMAHNLLGQYGDLKNMDDAKLADAIVSIDNFIKNGKSDITKRIEKLNEKTADQRLGVEEAADNIIKRNGADSERWTFSTLNGIFDYLEMLRDSSELSKEARSSYDRFIVELNSARQDKHGVISQALAELNDYIRVKLNIKERKALSERRDDLSEFDNNGQPMSLDNLLNVYMTHLQDDMIERVDKARKGWMNARINKKDVKKPDIVAQADMLPKMEKALGKDLIDVGLFLRELMNDPKRIDKMSTKYSEITASTLKLAPKYWTIVLENDPSIAKGGNLSIFKSFLKNRTGSLKAVDTQQSAFNLAQKHIIDAESFIAFADIFLSTKASYLAPDVMKKVGLAIGDTAMGHMTDMMADEINGSPLIKGEKVPWLDAITTTLVYKGLSYNPFSPFKQMVDFPSVGSMLPGFGKYWFDGFSDAGRAATEIMMKHPAVQARARDGYNQHTAEAIEEARGLGAGYFKKALMFGMKGIQKGDFLSVQLAAGPALRAAMDVPAIRDIKDAKKREKAATDYAVLQLERTLQSPHKTDRPHFVSRGGSVSRLFSLFSSALTPKAAQILKEIDTLRLGGWKNNPEAYKRLARKAAIYHGVAATLQWAVSVAIQLGFTDDELDSGEFWELLATMALGPFAGVPLLGVSLESAIGGMSGGSPRSDVAGGITRDVFKLAKLSKDTAMFVAGQSEKDYTEMMHEIWKKMFGTIPAARRVDQALDKWLLED